MVFVFARLPNVHSEENSNMLDELTARVRDLRARLVELGGHL